MNLYSTRDKAIKKCITQVSSSVQSLKDRHEQSIEEDPNIVRQLRTEQTKVSKVFPYGA